MRVKWGRRLSLLVARLPLAVVYQLPRLTSAGRVPAPRQSFHPFQPAGEPCGGDIHRKTLQRERQKSQESGRGHLEYFLALEHWEGVMPFGAGPVVPEFPQPAADPSGKKKAVKAARKTFREIAQKRRQGKAPVDRIQDKYESEPHQHEKIGGNPLRDYQREN